jgi:thymidylate synthase
MPDFMTTIRTTTLADSWFQLIYALVRGNVGRTVYTIDKGSYVGQKRLEFNYAVVQIDHPEVRPLIPDLPPHINIPAPVESMEYVEEYFSNYLMNPQLEENETYKYATWLAPGAERVIEQLKGAPGNNQAAISLGGWAPTSIEKDKSMAEQVLGIAIPTIKGDKSLSLSMDTDSYIDPATGQRDPACLRLVDFRYSSDGLLHMIVYFRSWDLWGGYPANLAGLQLYKEYIAESIGAKPGKTIAQSKGLHLYDHAIDVAAQRLGMTEVGTMDDLLDFTSEV